MKINWITYILVLSFGCLLFSCKNATEKTEDNSDTKEVIADTTEESEDEDDGPIDPVLTGKTKRDQIQAAPYSRWFQPHYDEYKVDQATVNAMGDKLRDAHITVFMGTWCEDSQREVPTLYKVLDAAEFNYNYSTLVTMTEDKDTPEGFEKGKDITNVPTIIVSVEGKEVGRIVEYPIESIEKDLQKILDGEDYKHAYAEEGEEE